MTHPLVERIEKVKRSARCLALLRATGCVLAAIVFCAILLATIDFLFRVEDIGTRTLLTLIWVSFSGAAIWYWLRPVWQMPFSNTLVAQMLEGRFPDLRDRLSSSLAFLKQSEEETPFGSKPLMRNLIAETTADIEELPVEQALDSGPVWQAVGWSAAAVGLCAILVLANPIIGPLAMKRLMLPWLDASWPRMHQLSFVEAPERVARGSDVRFVVEDATGRPPTRVELEIGFDSNRRIESLPMSRVGNQLVLTRKNVTRAMRYRAVGGDDTAMKWKTVEVVDPPTIVSGTIKFEPPSYTGWLPRELGQSIGGLRVLEGTHVSFAGEANQSLSDAYVKYRVGEETKRVGGQVEGTKGYRVPNEAESWEVTRPGQYSLTLTGSDMSSDIDGELWDVRVVQDQPPTIAMLDPVSEEWITPNAQLSMQIVAEDDFRVAQVDLQFMRTDRSDAGESVVQLYYAAADREAVEMPVELNVSVDRQTLDYEWSLEDLSLTHGAVLTYFLSAKDFKGQEATSPSRRLLVVNEQELIDRVARRHSVVLSRLQQHLQQQRQAKQQVDAVKSTLFETKRIEKSTMDRLQSGLLSQRQVNTAIVGEDATLTLELRGLQLTLNRSKILDGKTKQSVSKTLEALSSLSESHLSPALDTAAAAQQVLQAALDGQAFEPPKEATRFLSATSAHQAAVIKSMETLLDDMSTWDNYRRLAQDLTELHRQQDEVRRLTQDVAKQTLARDSDDLDGEQRAELRSAAARQLDLARRMDRTLDNLSKAEEKVRGSDPASEQMLGDAIQTARDLAVGGRMRQAGRMIDQNRLGKAAQEQAAASNALEEMLDQLSRRSYSAGESERRLADADRQLQRLQDEQGQISNALKRTAKQPDSQKRQRELQRLSERQQQQMEEMQKLGRTLERLRAKPASSQLEKASAAANEVSSAAKQGSALRAQQQSELAEAQMEQARAELQEQAERVRSQLVREQMLKLPQQVESLLQRQQGVTAEIERLNDLRQSRGEWTPGMQASTEIAAETERSLSGDSLELGTELKSLPAFSFSLKETATSMSEVAESLEQGNTSSVTQRLAEQVEAALTFMLDTMKKDSGGGGDSGGQGGSSQGGGNEGNQGEDFEPSLAQIKMLRGLQETINEETERLNGMQAGDAAAQRALDEDLRRVSDRQSRLADLVSEMTRPATAPRRKVEQNKPPPGNFDELDQQLDSLLQ